LLTEDDRRRVVRNGYLPEREIQTGVAVRQPRVRDRGAAEDATPIHFTSALLLATMCD
jgi:hypothetical protein